MQFRIDTTSQMKSEDDYLYNYPCLAAFGFKVIPKDHTERVYFRDECGKRRYRDITETKMIPVIEINTIEELEKLREAVREELIFGKDWNDISYIEIYDGYRE